MLSGRTIHFPINVRAPRLARSVLDVARALASGDLRAAAQIGEALAMAPAMHEVVSPSPGKVVSPTLRAQVLARLLLDLAASGWTTTVDEGQVYLCAPRWSVGGSGLTPEEVRAEKARARQSMVARVQEQLESDATRRFILEQEQAHLGRDGARSILSLLADGPSLAATLRREGPAGIRPYLQVADRDAGRDAHTGLRLGDIFRYFRYFWSFPYSSTPGRTLSLLIRDAGQPGHPVCGLLCLTSPVPKLAARDSALGWTPAWLEAVVAALDLPAEAPERHLRAVEQALLSNQEGSPEPARLFRDLGRLLGVAETEGETDAHTLGRRLRALGPTALRRRVSTARQRLLSELISEVEQAIRGISLEGLGVSHEKALLKPGTARKILLERAGEARETWLESRRIASAREGGPARASADQLEEPRSLRERANDPLFLKKRAAQAASLLGAWEELQTLGAGGGAEQLRRLVLGAPGPWVATSARLSGGEHVSRGLRSALLQRQARFVASQVAEVSVCGALPPYGPLLGGKLAALLALSREVAEFYHKRYDGQASHIGSQMAGRHVYRSAELLALSTASFFGVGSSQYSRVALPPELGGVRWEFTGYSRGHGTLHFSRQATLLLQRLLRLETGRGLITSTFGEGPSERLRKVREGLEQIGLPAEELLQHGMPRQVFVAELRPGETRPGARAAGRSWRRVGPPAEAVAEFWRARWLGPRLERLPGLLELTAAFSRESVLLSRRLCADPLSPELWAAGVSP